MGASESKGDWCDIVERAGGVAPAEIRRAVNEHVDLPAGRPDRWKHGYVFRGVMSDCRGRDDTAAPGAMAPTGLSLRDADGPLTVGVDVIVDPVWGVATRTRALSAPVLADYTFSLLRVDALVRDGAGVRIIRGHSHLTNPYPPEIPEGCLHLANVFVDYFGSPADAVILPLETADAFVVSAPQLELLPGVARARAAGRPVRVTCWGDSVTAGGSASDETTTYPRRLERLLQSGGLPAVVSTVAVGGSTSGQWLGRAAPMPGTDWSHVEATAPDVVVLEFINDAELDPDAWPALYEEIRSRVGHVGADLLILEPHFSRPDWMRMTRLDDPDPRAYVAFLREFAREHQVAIASVSRRWERLFRQGVPFPTLLRNGINHPDDRGHRIFAEEAASVLGVRPTVPPEGRDLAASIALHGGALGGARE